MRSDVIVVSLLACFVNGAPLKNVTAPIVTPFLSATAPTPTTVASTPATPTWDHINVEPAVNTVNPTWGYTNIEPMSSAAAHKSWIHFRRELSICIHEDAGGGASKRYCKLEPSPNGEVPVAPLLTSNITSGRRDLDDHTKLLDTEPFIAEDATKTLTRGLFQKLQGGSQSYCEASDLKTYSLDFDPGAKYDGCHRPVRYLDQQPGYFLATQLNQTNPLVVMGVCYVQAIRKVILDVNILFQFATKDVANVLAEFLVTEAIKDNGEIFLNTVGEITCSDSVLGWVLTGYYQMV